MSYATSTGWSEIEKICKKRKITPTKLLEEKLELLQKQISNSDAQLIAALERSYKPISADMSPAHYTIAEEMHIGIITPKTRFDTDFSRIGMFLKGIKNSYSFVLGHEWRKTEFVAEIQNSFMARELNTLDLLYSWQSPPIPPQDSFESGFAGPNGSTTHVRSLRQREYGTPRPNGFGSSQNWANRI